MGSCCAGCGRDIVPCKIWCSSVTGIYGMLCAWKKMKPEERKKKCNITTCICVSIGFILSITWLVSIMPKRLPFVHNYVVPSAVDNALGKIPDARGAMMKKLTTDGLDPVMDTILKTDVKGLKENYAMIRQLDYLRANGTEIPDAVYDKYQIPQVWSAYKGGNWFLGASSFLLTWPRQIVIWCADWMFIGKGMTGIAHNYSYAVQTGFQYHFLLAVPNIL